jgi:hypothetical protein
MPFYEKGDVRIRYEETGSGFPLLVTPGGGLNSKVSNWPTAVFKTLKHLPENQWPEADRQVECIDDQRQSAATDRNSQQ